MNFFKKILLILFCTILFQCTSSTPDNSGNGNDGNLEEGGGEGGLPSGDNKEPECVDPNGPLAKSDLCVFTKYLAKISPIGSNLQFRMKINDNIINKSYKEGLVSFEKTIDLKGKQSAQFCNQMISTGILNDNTPLVFYQFDLSTGKRVIITNNAKNYISSYPDNCESVSDTNQFKDTLTIGFTSNNQYFRLARLINYEPSA